MGMVIWFNDGLSVMAEAIEALRASSLEIEKIVVTHKNKHFVGFKQADFCLVEGAFSSREAYVSWALNFAGQHQVTHFFVGRHSMSMIKAADRFSDIGVKLMFSLNHDQWEDIDSKSRFYNRLVKAGHASMIPAWSLWLDSQPADLKGHIEDIRSSAQGRVACVKPVTGIFGQGYFQFSDAPDPGQQLMAPEIKIIKPSDFCSLTTQQFEKTGKAKEWMVMEYLPGPEYSVDTLAHDGEIVTFVTRQKSDTAGEGQLIVSDPEINEHLKSLATTFKLNGVFNAQFRRDAEGRIKVLEINPRFSGGMGMSLRAGVNLPQWWLRVTEDPSLIEQAPQAHIGLRVYSWHQAIELPTVNDNTDMAQR